jgi:hypothetical protein
MSRERYDVNTLEQFVGQNKGRFLLTFQNTVEIEGEKKPALIAETLALLLTGS